MKLKRPCILRWQTFCLLLFMWVAGSSLTWANFRANGDLEMPDITGTWRAQFVPPNDNPITHAHMEIRRVQQGEIDFLIDMPWVKEFSRVAVTWSAARQRFEGEFNDDDDQTRSTFTLQPQADVNSLRVIITNRNPSKAKQSDPSNKNSDRTEEYVTQIWTRTSMNFATTYPAEELGQPQTPPLAENSTQAGMHGPNRATDPGTPNQITPQSSAVPDTPAAKQLVEQLAAQESAAASAANEIRRLRANGSAVETIEPHQAQLKAHLQTAFELKMQLEELQVKELQSRLSRLERQIRQRKELREKIIDRRAAELLNPDVNWDTTSTTQPASASEPGGTRDKTSGDSLSKQETIQQQIESLQAKRAKLRANLGNEHPEIKGLDKQIDTLRTTMVAESEKPITVLYMKNAKAQNAAEIIQQLYPNKADTIVADDRTNSLFVRGDEKLIRDLEQLLQVLDAEAASNGVSESQPVFDPDGDNNGGALLKKGDVGH